MDWSDVRKAREDHTMGGQGSMVKLGGNAHPEEAIGNAQATNFNRSSKRRTNTPHRPGLTVGVAVNQCLRCKGYNHRAAVCTEKDI